MIVVLPLAKKAQMFLKTSAFFIVIFTCCLASPGLQAQCTAVINSFPYDEGFEAGQGNWSASSNQHWQWGTPVGKAVIPGAAAGAKCWIAGGLSGSNYNSGSSELLSPCFDFSSLSYPQLSFSVFWETELRFDGVSLLYTIDNGSNWLPLGTANSNDPCLGIENWFNYSPVNFIGNRPGWSGNVQSGGGSCLSGQGSGQWVTAKHNLSVVAGQPNVIFKFVFGAGTICNGYDGFAIDNIHIAETPANTGDFSFTCGANNAVQFINAALPCQAGWIWDFGDPASGSSNNSSDENPSHIFSAPGVYSVNLTVNYDFGPPVVVPAKTVRVLAVNTVIDSISCNGANDGRITVSVSPAGSYTYSWNTTPPQNGPVISNLSAGIAYTVTVSAPNVCSVSVPVTLIQPAALAASPVVRDARCGNNNGSILSNPSGGTPPYRFSWSNGSSTENVSSLAPGTFGFTLSDARNCSLPPFTNLVVGAVTNTVRPNLGNNQIICPGQSLQLTPGSFATYRWQDNSSTPTFSVKNTGVYYVEVTDADGCKGSDTVTVTVDCRDIYFPSAFTPNGDALNHDFGVLGDIPSLSKFNLAIYNRYAEVLFTAGNPNDRWDGTFKGKPVEQGSYVWIAVYRVRGGKPITKKGSLLLLR